MMELKILSDTNNVLLSRREIKFRVDHKGASTPKKLEVANLLSAKLNTKLDDMLVQDYVTGFGKDFSEGRCFVYKDEKAMKRVNHEKLLKPKKRIGEKEKGESSDKAQDSKKA
jgi:small subunit ribosomal protein S24e